jgi:Tol biopolymer transport system component
VFAIPLVRHLQFPRWPGRGAARPGLPALRGNTVEVCMSGFFSFRRPVFALALFAFCGLSVPAAAQYFGQNKVQYRSFDFQIMRTDHFDIYFYESERPGIEIAARMAERWRVRLEKLLNHELSGRQPLVLYGSHTDFEQTNVIGGAIGEGTGGVTEPIRRRIVLPLAGPLADTDHVIGHELVHAFQFDMTTGPDSPPGRSGMDRLPLWFIEGLAEYLSIGPVDPNTAMWLRDAARQEKLPAIKDLNNPKYFPYRWGQAVWAYIGGRWGDEVIGQLFQTAAATGDLDAAFDHVLGVKTADLTTEWHSSIQRAYSNVLADASRPDQIGKLVIGGKELGEELNVGPSISPDGQWIAFLSTRSLFSTDLYLAEAATGRIVRKLTSTATDPHTSSIQFIYSAGAWDSASRQIAVGTVRSGRAALAIFDAQKGSRTREIDVPDVDEILNPTWSPDGKAIAFTGMQRGLTDLFVYDLSASNLRRLTNDAFAEVHPAWSPDGRRIAFATDRLNSNLSTLAIGPYRLALIDPATGAVEAVQGFEGAKHLNPQWAPDSQALYFISDRGGVPNVYRVGLGAQGSGTTQVTNLATGVSGITATSPAMSVASRTGAVAFSIYQDGKYEIFTVEGARGGPPVKVSDNAAVLPPLDRKASEVAQLLASPSDGLPEPAKPEVEPYSAKLHIEGVAQPVVGVGVSRFGTSFGGGIALAFSDMLRNHQLVTAFQVNSGLGRSTSFKDIGMQVGYFNQANRWNWGLIGGQVPYLSSGFQSSLSQRPNGDVIQTDQLFVFRQTERTATGVLAYPFNRASRVEVQGGVSQISFDQIVTTQSYSRITGAVFEDSTETTPIGETLSLGTSSAAYVFDTSIFGATSPVQGQRSRFEVSPTFGTLNFTGVLADYRRYFMPVNFYTLGVRVMHYGRYGSGGSDPRIFPLYIGYPWLVRGYDVGSFDNSECLSDGTTSCAAIDRLVGSRMLVGNVEFRFPLLRPFGVSGNMYGPVPVEVAFFADGGTAWNNGERPDIFGGSRGGVSSAGVAFRVNLFGFAVGEFDVTRPFQRPGRGWIFGFNLMPGW